MLIHVGYVEKMIIFNDLFENHVLICVVVQFCLICLYFLLQGGRLLFGCEKSEEGFKSFSPKSLN